jgi:hypothetical protein
VLGFFATGAAIVLFGLSFASALREATHGAAPVRPSRILSSLGILVVTYLLTIGLWRSVIAQFGVRLSYSDALKLWSFTNVGRYLPGKVWQVVGIAVLGKRHGIDPLRAGGIAVVTLGFMIGTGAMLGLLCLPESGQVAGGLRVGAIALGLAFLAVIAWPRVLAEGMHRIPGVRRAGDVIHVPSRVRLTVVLFAFGAIWILQGLSFHVLASAWIDLPWSELPRLTGAYAVSHVAGLLAVFAPGGIGVREGILGVLLRPIGDQGLPVYLTAVGSRLLSMIAELVVLAVAIVLHLGSGRQSVNAGS